MSNRYLAAQVIEDTCPHCGRNLAMQTETQNARTVYLVTCTSRRCGFRRVKRVFRVVRTA